MSFPGDGDRPRWPVGPADGWAEGEVRTVDCDGRVVLVARSDGRFLAIKDVCPHDGTPLSGGPVAGGEIACPRHGWRVRLSDGEVTRGMPGIRVGCHAVQVVDGVVHVVG